MAAEHRVSKIHIKFKELDTKKMKMPLIFILIIYGNNIFGYSWLLKYCILIKLILPVKKITIIISIIINNKCNIIIIINLILIFIIVTILAALCCMQDLSSPTRD